MSATPARPVDEQPARDDRTCEAVTRDGAGQPARCRHLRAQGSDLCYGHKSIEAAGGEVRRAARG